MKAQTEIQAQTTKAQIEAEALMRAAEIEAITSMQELEVEVAGIGVEARSARREAARAGAEGG